jgi:hypothetical protein
MTINPVKLVHITRTIDPMTGMHKLILSNRYLRYTPFWWWYRLMSHEGFRFDDYHVWGEFWHSLNRGWEHIQYVNEFEKFWGKGSYPPKTIFLKEGDFDALVEKLSLPSEATMESIKRLMNRKAPWDD